MSNVTTFVAKKSTLGPPHPIDRSRSRRSVVWRWRRPMPLWNVGAYCPGYLSDAASSGAWSYPSGRSIGISRPSGRGRAATADQSDSSPESRR